jgi:Fur family ferric uptake transcriptional regulator
MFGENWYSYLQENGYRVTAPRKAVVTVLVSSNRALTPVEVFEEAVKKCPGLGLVSVYRTLEKFEELGLILRVHQTKNCQAFIKAGKGHQHLMICKKCGKSVYFEGDRLDLLFDNISKSTGFTIEDHWLQVYGICRDCNKTSNLPSK